MKSTLTLGVLIAALFSAPLAAELISAKSDGIMELPRLYVYASDSESVKSNSIPVNSDWKFEKSLDFQSKPDVTIVEGPGDAIYSVSTPRIQTYLINADLTGS